MRIEPNRRTGSVGARTGVGRATGGPDFMPLDAGAPQRAGQSSASAQVGGIDALLALQTVGDATEGRRRMVRRGRAMLDGLDELRVAVLGGRLDDSQLDRLAGELTLARDMADPSLDAVIDDIELRVRVELAKRGRFP